MAIVPQETKLRRGTTAENDAFTGAEAEVTVDTTTDTLRVHDNSTAGGLEVTSNAATQTLTNKTLTTPTIADLTNAGHDHSNAAGGGALNATNTDLVTTANLTTVGALNAGSITSGFGSIDNGASAITTTGTGTFGLLAVDNIQINGNAITSTDTAGDITLTPDTTGDVVIDGLKHPQADGTSGQVIQTDGAGQLSFATPAGGGNMSTSTYDPAAIAEQLVGLVATQTLTNKQMTTIELGHATDTTISRASAGDINIEGNIAYRAGGTDVPVTDGGTGVSTLADGGILLGSGTGAITAMATLADGSIVVGDGTTDPVALAAFDSSTGNLLGTKGGSIGQQTIFYPGGAMEAAVTTAPATSNAVEIGTSLFAARTMDFATDADDFAYFGIQFPKGWDAGTLICQFVWSATGTTANTVLWAIAATSLADDEGLTTAFPAPVSPAADTNSTTADDIMISEEVTVTVGSTPTAENYVIFEVSRDVSGDTLAEDARLHGLRIHYTVNTGVDT